MLFALDPAQHRISVAAEEGAATLRKEAVADLIYSPVRDVAPLGNALINLDGVLTALASRLNPVHNGQHGQPLAARMLGT